ncbi:MAG: hypothetical protein L6R40_003746 [Gallowayella cf. fulva]|nr:MAG: hypothetical protein L6R40_003746 [Xanthomendoza cf. fulva]
MATLQSNPTGQPSEIREPEQSPGQANESNHYSFPRSRLRHSMSDSSKTPLLLVACGSFSPITYLHLRMFEMAADYAKYNTDLEVIGGYLSPVSDAYRKAGLASAEHRLAMTRIATEQSSKWLDVDPWEAIQKEYQPTAIVLDHFEHEINVVQRGIATREGERKAVKIVLLAGADLIQTMSTPGVWSKEDLNHILGQYGVFIVERTGTDIDDALAALIQWRQNIWVIQQLIQNDVSSTKIRLFLKREMSVRYLVPAPVITRANFATYKQRESNTSPKTSIDPAPLPLPLYDDSLSPRLDTSLRHTATHEFSTHCYHRLQAGTKLNILTLRKPAKCGDLACILRYSPLDQNKDLAKSSPSTLQA